MGLLQRLLARLLPALIVAAGVTLLAAGLLSYSAPTAAGDPSPTTGLESDAPLTTIVPATAPATTPASADPTASVASASTGGPVSAPPTLVPKPTLVASGVPTRIVVPAYRIDLPVVSGELNPAGNPDHYPLCDVAMYLTRYPNQPALAGSATYVYAHARTGMFLPLLTASQRRDGAAMIGTLVQVYTSDNRLYVYEIVRVKRHSTNFELADQVPANEHRLVLQTSEGPKGTIPKLQIAARLIASQAAAARDAHPTARPRICA